VDTIGGVARATLDRGSWRRIIHLLATNQG
jgi:hypothetical protein